MKENDGPNISYEMISEMTNSIYFQRGEEYQSWGMVTQGSLKRLFKKFNFIIRGKIVQFHYQGENSDFFYIFYSFFWTRRKFIFRNVFQLCK